MMKTILFRKIIERFDFNEFRTDLLFVTVMIKHIIYHLTSIFSILPHFPGPAV